jgi:hypothetical protein
MSTHAEQRCRVCGCAFVQHGYAQYADVHCDEIDGKLEVVDVLRLDISDSRDSISELLNVCLTYNSYFSYLLLRIEA